MSSTKKNQVKNVSTNCIASDDVITFKSLYNVVENIPKKKA